MEIVSMDLTNTEIKLPPKARQQKINGTIYVYLDKPFWNTERKRGEHKREYIGKMIDDHFVPNKLYISQIEAAALREHNAANLSDEGYFSSVLVFLDYLAEKYQLKQNLKMYFSENYKQLLVLCFFLTLEDAVFFSRFNTWAVINNLDTELQLSENSISRLLSAQSPDAYLCCAKNIMNNFSFGELIAYDIHLKESQSGNTCLNYTSTETAVLSTSRYLVIVHEELGLPLFIQDIPEKIPFTQVRDLFVENEGVLANSVFKVFDTPYIEFQSGPSFSHSSTLQRVCKMLHRVKEYKDSVNPSLGSVEVLAYFYLSLLSCQLYTLLKWWASLFFMMPEEQLISYFYQLDRLQDAPFEGVKQSDYAALKLLKQQLVLLHKF